MFQMMLIIMYFISKLTLILFNAYMITFLLIDNSRLNNINLFNVEYIDNNIYILIFIYTFIVMLIGCSAAFYQTIRDEFCSSIPSRVLNGDMNIPLAFLHTFLPFLPLQYFFKSYIKKQNNQDKRKNGEFTFLRILPPPNSNTERLIEPDYQDDEGYDSELCSEASDYQDCEENHKELYSEEDLRSYILKKLVSDFGFRRSDIGKEFPIRMGRAAKRADIVIFQSGRAHEQNNILIVIECKRPHDRISDEMLEQLHSYMSACLNVRYGVLAASEWRVFEKALAYEGYKLVETDGLPNSQGIITPFEYPSKVQKQKTIGSFFDQSASNRLAGS